jgi:NAD(P)-dependent dehydrogenase (short-subunit alcohol dehydrogenase family)
LKRLLIPAFGETFYYKTNLLNFLMLWFVSINKQRNNMRFKDKAIMIVGATGGIGSITARRISEEAGNLILVAKDLSKLESLQKELKTKSIIQSIDATKTDELHKTVHKGEQEFGKIDVLIHAVGSIVLKSLQTISESIFRETLELNLISPFLSIKAVLNGMLKNKSGSVVVVSSVAGSTGLTNHEAISAAKGGLEAMIRSSSITYAKRGIRFNAVALGLVETPMAYFLTSNENSLKVSQALHPMGRIGTPEDVVEGILYLASEDSKWTTGVVLPIDGGMAAGR